MILDAHKEREPETHHHPSTIIERDLFEVAGDFVRDGIMFGSHTNLHVFCGVSGCIVRYFIKILFSQVRLCIGAVGLDFFFLNAPQHRTVAVKELLESDNIRCINWPSKSTDLNVIQQMQDRVGRSLASRD